MAEEIPTIATKKSVWILYSEMYGEVPIALFETSQKGVEFMRSYGWYPKREEVCEDCGGIKYHYNISSVEIKNNGLFQVIWTKPRNKRTKKKSNLFTLREVVLNKVIIDAIMVD